MPDSYFTHNHTNLKRRDSPDGFGFAANYLGSNPCYTTITALLAQ